MTKGYMIVKKSVLGLISLEGEWGLFSKNI